MRHLSVLHEAMDIVGTRIQHDRFCSCLRSAIRVEERSRILIDEMKGRRSGSGTAASGIETLKQAVEMLRQDLDLLLRTLSGAQREAALSRIGRVSRLTDQIDSSMRELEPSLAAGRGYRRALRHLHRIGWTVRSWKIQCTKMARTLYLSAE